MSFSIEKRHYVFSYFFYILQNVEHSRFRVFGFRVFWQLRSCAAAASGLLRRGPAASRQAAALIFRLIIIIYFFTNNNFRPRPDLNPRPLAPWATVYPLDQCCKHEKHSVKYLNETPLYRTSLCTVVALSTITQLWRHYYNLGYRPTNSKRLQS